MGHVSSTQQFDDGCGRLATSESFRKTPCTLLRHPPLVRRQPAEDVPGAVGIDLVVFSTTAFAASGKETDVIGAITGRARDSNVGASGAGLGSAKSA